MTKRRAEPADPAAELRELIREAHGAARDLAVVLRECRKLRAELVAEVRQAAHKAADDEVKRLSRHLQGDLNRLAGRLNEAVARAQKNIINSLTAARAVVADDGESLRFTFEGGAFDDDIPLPPGGDQP